MLVYVDGTINLENDPKQDMNALNCTYGLKQEIIRPTKIYLGSNTKKFQMENGKQCQSIHCVDFIQEDVKNVEDILSKDHGAYIKQYGKGNMPYPQNNRPKVDITNELDEDGISRYQKFVGTLYG